MKITQANQRERTVYESELAHPAQTPSLIGCPITSVADHKNTWL